MKRRKRCQRCELWAGRALADLEQLAAWLESGLQVPIVSHFPVKNLNAALAQLSKGQVRGRVLVQVEGGFTTQ